MLLYIRGRYLSNILKYILIIFVALQPLHSYTIINTNNPDNNNGFQHLDAELCGSKYSNSISHTQKISDLLDTVNSLFISDMSIDCVCCESLDIAPLDSINASVNHLLVTPDGIISYTNFYTITFNKQLSKRAHPRAPPFV